MRMRTGRPRNFDESDALARVMESFWKRGYDATTFEHLVQDSRLSRSSLYNAFGGKDALFSKAIELYLDREQSEFLDKLNDEASGPEFLLSVIESLQMPYDRRAKGCLLQKIILRNAADGGKPKVEGRIAKSLSSMWSSITKAIGGLRRREQAASESERAAVVLACLFGIAVIARNGRNQELVESISSGLNAMVGSK